MEAAPSGPVRLAVSGLTLPGSSEFAATLRDVSLEVRGGEVVGIAGVAGEGQAELMAALSGERLSRRADAVAIDGRPVGREGPTGRRLAGAAFVPEERNGHGAVAEMTLPENVVLTHHRAERIARGGWIDWRTIQSVPPSSGGRWCSQAIWVPLRLESAVLTARCASRSTHHPSSPSGMF